MLSLHIDCNRMPTKIACRDKRQQTTHEDRQTETDVMRSSIRKKNTCIDAQRHTQKHDDIHEHAETFTATSALANEGGARRKP